MRALGQLSFQETAANLPLKSLKNHASDSKTLPATSSCGRVSFLPQPLPPVPRAVLEAEEEKGSETVSQRTVEREEEGTA